MKRPLLLLGIGALLGVAAAWTPTTLGSGPADPPRAAPPLSATYNPVSSFAPLVQAVQPAVLAIRIEGAGVEPIPFFGPTEGTMKPQGEGSAFIIDETGLVLTNAHVVEGAQRIVAVLPDKTEVNAAVLGRDRSLDVALLQLEGEGSWPHVKLGSSSALAVGDWVLAMGNPLGLGHTVTAGIVSGKGRVLGHDIFGNDAFIQTDAAINQGNSGGPLFDLDGEVVGMSTAIIQGANTIGFAIPIDLIKSTVEDLQTRGYVARGYLGVRPQSLTPALAQAMELGTTEGAIINEVYEETPAARSQLRRGDVVVRVDQTEIGGAEDLIAAIGNRQPGDWVDLHRVRSGQRKKVRLRLAVRPTPAAELEPPLSTDLLGRLGLGLRPLPPALAASTGVDDGVLVDRVAGGSPAMGHLQPGDIVIKAEGREVSTPTEFARALRKANPSATLLVLREGDLVFVPLPMP